MTASSVVRWMNYHPWVSIMFLFVIGFLLMWLYKPWPHALGDMVAASLAGAVIDIFVLNKEKEAGEVD